MVLPARPGARAPGKDPPMDYTEADIAGPPLRTAKEATLRTPGIQFVCEDFERPCGRGDCEGCSTIDTCASAELLDRDG